MERPGGKILKKCQKVWKSVKNYETILPFSFSLLQYRMKFSIENVFFIPGPSLAAENRAGDWNFQSGMNISNREWNSQAGMKVKLSFVRGGVIFHASEREWFFSILGPSGNFRKSAPRVKKAILGAHFRIFSVFFSYFRGPTRGGGFRDFFRIFFVFPGLRGFWALYQERGIATTGDEIITYYMLKS